MIEQANERGRTRSGFNEIAATHAAWLQHVTWIAWLLPYLMEIMVEKNSPNIGIQRLIEDINSTNPSGKLVFHLFGAIAKSKRILIKD